jgi:competence ComEA-like helix-hairpin-helix protein
VSFVAMSSRTSRPGTGVKALHFPQAAAVATILLLASVATLSAPKKTLPSHRIDLNRATLAQLERLPDIGPVKARAILRFRQDSGPFERVDDLLAVRGISRRRLDKIRPYVFVGKPKRSSSHSSRRPAKPASRSAPHH